MPLYPCGTACAAFGCAPGAGRISPGTGTGRQKGEENMRGKRSIRQQFLYKKSYLKRRLQHDVMEDGTAYIPCRVDGLEDIISRFSIRGLETLNPEFQSFITEYAEFIPTECPLVLEIYGPEFSDGEKRIITDAIAADLDYMLGKNEEMNLRRRRRFFAMIAGTLISGIVMTLVKPYVFDFPMELFYVIFWLFADSFVRYLFIDKLTFREERIRMGRLASMKVSFMGPQAEE